MGWRRVTEADERTPRDGTEDAGASSETIEAIGAVLAPPLSLAGSMSPAPADRPSAVPAAPALVACARPEEIALDSSEEAEAAPNMTPIGVDGLGNQGSTPASAEAISTVAADLEVDSAANISTPPPADNTADSAAPPSTLSSAHVPKPSAVPTPSVLPVVTCNLTAPAEIAPTEIASAVPAPAVQTVAPSDLPVLATPPSQPGSTSPDEARSALLRSLPPTRVGTVAATYVPLVHGCVRLSVFTGITVYPGGRCKSLELPECNFRLVGCAGSGSSASRGAHGYG